MVIVPEKNIIRLKRGDTGMMSITVTDEATGEEVKDYIGKFTLKRELRDNTFALQKVIIAGEIAFEHDDTQTMDFGNYYYDIQITSGGQVQTFGPHLFQLLPDVTTR